MPADRRQPPKLAVAAFVFLIAAGIGAAAVTSVDEVSFNSNSAFFDGRTFVIEFTSSGGTDAIDVTLSEEELSRAADGEAKRSLSIDMTAQETYARYSFQDAGIRDLVNLDLVTHVSDTEETAADWAADHCYDVDADGNSEYYQTAVWTWTGEIDIKVWCARENGQYGSVADISSADEVFTSRWCVKASGKDRECATVSNGDAGDGRRTRLGDHVIIDWQGSLDTGESPPAVDDELGLHSNTIDGNWRVISEREYNEWQDYVSGLSEDYGDWANGEISESDLQSNIDSRAESASAVFSQSPLSGGTVLDASKASGQWKLDLADQLAYPSFAVYVDGAEYVEVSKPVGTAEIVSTSGDEFGELESGTVSMTVKNVGSGEGSFSGRITSCSNGFSFDDTQRTKTVGPGDEVSYSFRVSFTADSSTQQEVSGSCTFEVMNQEGERVTSDVAVTGVQEEECTPGKQFVKVVDGTETIFECSEDGLSYSEVDACAADEDAVFKQDRYECVTQEQPSGGSGAGGLLTGMLPGFLQSPVEDITSGVSSFVGGLLLLLHTIAAVVVAGVVFQLGRVAAGVVDVGDPRLAVAGAAGTAVVAGGAVFLVHSVFLSGGVLAVAVAFGWAKGLLQIPGVG